MGPAREPGDDAATAPEPACPDSGVGLQWQSPMLVALRVAQFLVDLGIVAATCYAASLVMFVLPKAPDGTYASPLLTLGAVALVLGAAVVINIWYWVHWPARHDGQTVAMGWLGLRVVSIDRPEVTSVQLGLRLLLLAADGMLLGLVGLTTMLSNPARQRLGDVVAGTKVVPVPRIRSRSAESAPDGTGPAGRPASADLVVPQEDPTVAG